jgi:hypothetical protein
MFCLSLSCTRSPTVPANKPQPCGQLKRNPLFLRSPSQTGFNSLPVTKPARMAQASWTVEWSFWFLR